MGTTQPHALSTGHSGLTSNGRTGIQDVVRVERLLDTPVELHRLGPDLVGQPRPLQPADAVLAFGTERHGLSDALLAHADARLRLPMRPGVSSLNLATAVAAVLFAWRLSAGGDVSAPAPSA